MLPCSEISYLKNKGTSATVYSGKRKVTTAEGTPATDAPQLFMQVVLLSWRLKAGTGYSSSQSVAEPCQREGIPSEELCPFYALNSARKDMWETSVFLSSALLFPVFYGLLFIKCIYGACYVKIMNSLVCTISIMKGNRYCS